MNVTITPPLEEEPKEQVKPPDDPDAGAATGEDPANGAAAQEEGATLSIGDTSINPHDEEKAPEWVKEVRRRNRELVHQNRELEERLAKIAAPAKQAPMLPAKPTLESCDWDEERFTNELDLWHESKHKFDAYQKEQETEAKRAEETWKAKLNGYQEGKTKLPFRDVEEAEAEARTIFNQTQQGIIVQGAENPALVVYALGKDPERARQLANIKDHVQFAFAISRLEASLKINRKTANQLPPPEEGPKGTSHGAGGIGDSVLENLRDEAARTGDYTKVIAYRQSKRKTE